MRCKRTKISPPRNLTILSGLVLKIPNSFEKDDESPNPSPFLEVVFVGLFSGAFAVSFRGGVKVANPWMFF